ncbi:phenylacetate--CoA ligase family protein [Rhodobacteraceae bacterium RKSG542]|uniref:phenylacetate--CoA ligase family protein n=1 Tax=Pseudovibrio flavus TaxID=2529854 RepID=UPI0012BBECC4|nr:AMP-binding protein [Pseudovibrio flavus]MTI16913.1 phenylacetate--CoA ligase family protein [Pseudovibrio flavus]
MDLEYFDHLETRSEDEREAQLFSRLPEFIGRVQKGSQGWASYLEGVDASAVTSREALAKLPVFRKSSLLKAQEDDPVFGGYVMGSAASLDRVFMSPGPIWEPQGTGKDPWNGSRALYAAGVRSGDKVHNAFSYHMTPGGFILDYSARALGCTVFPAGVGNTDLQVQAISMLRPSVYTGTPDYLKIILDRADELGVDVSSITKALVSGGALYPSLRQEYADRGIAVRQCYATADLGIISYESDAMEGMIVNEDYIVEIVRPGTGEPVAPGEVGELVVTSFNETYPLIRFATGDLSAVLPGTSSCGRTNMRIKGWMGRADQRTKIKGMFVDPVQVNRVKEANAGVSKLRLSVVRDGEKDHMVLRAEAGSINDDLLKALGASLREHTGLAGEVELVAVGSLPNDGKVISDERPLENA